MKKLCLFVVSLFVLTGCTDQKSELQQGMDLRDRLNKEKCSFTAVVTADYGEYAYSFTIGCSVDEQGDIAFIVLAPESISGIGGKITEDSGFLTFDDAALAFPLLADGEVSPISAPWLLIHSLRGGYMVAGGQENELYRLTLRDSYEDDALQVDVWLNRDNIPQKAEILWEGRRVLSLHIEDFTFV